MRIKRFLLKFLYVFLGLAAGHLSFYAEPFDITFEQIIRDTDMSRGSIFTIIQDKLGFLWFCTSDGLNRYDGYQTLLYQFDSTDSTSLSSNFVYVIYEDRQGDMWIGTDGGGLNRFDRNLEQFIHYQYRSDDETSISDNSVPSIFEDHTGTLWIGTKHGLNRYDRAGDCFFRYFHDPQDNKSLSNDFIWAICEDSADNLWFGTNIGLNRLDPMRQKFDRFINRADDSTSISHNYVYALCLDHRGQLWVGTHWGLNRWDASTERFIRYFHQSDQPGSLSYNKIWRVMEDQERNLWIGTLGGGLNRYEPSEDAFVRYQHHELDPASLSHDKIWSIYQDRSGIIWVGTEIGLNKFYFKQGQLRHYYRRPWLDNTLSDNYIRCVIETRDCRIWIGAHSGGLNCWDRKNQQFTHFENRQNDRSSIRSNSIWSLLEDEKGLLWVGTNNGGLNCLDRKTNTFKTWLSDDSDNLSLSSNTIREIYLDRNNNMWLATYGGLNLFDRETGKAERYPANPDAPGSISHNWVFCLLEDIQGNFWVGTKYGLNIFNRRTKRFFPFYHDHTDTLSLSGNEIYDLHQDQSGNLWIATDHGLNRFCYEDSTFERFSNINDVSNRLIYAIREDNSQNLWLSTNSKIVKFSPVTSFTKFYSLNSQTSFNDFQPGVSAQTESGEFIFGGKNGFVLFHPDTLFDNPIAPQVALTDFKIFNHSLKISERSWYTRSISLIDSIELYHGDDFFSFEFSALHFLNPERNQFAYYMEGFDKEWVYSSNRRFASYTNLDPGRYTFRVKACNSNGIWNNTGIAIVLRIIPPFWRTSVFLIALIIIIITSIVSYYRIRTATIRKRNRQLTEYNQELNDQIKYRLQVEHELKMTRNYLQNVFDSFPSVLIAANPKGMINQWNKTAELFFGKLPGENENNYLWKLVPFMDEYREIFFNVPETARPREFERIDEIAGVKYDLRILFYPIDHNGSNDWVIRIDDVSELRKKEEQLRQSQKMELIGNLAGGLAHDFNNILGAIIGTISLIDYLLKSDRFDLSRFTNYITIIRESANRGSELVQQLMMLSKRQELVFHISDLNQITGNALKIGCNIIDKSIKINFHPHESNALVNADPFQLEQVFLNLFINAADAMTIMRDSELLYGGDLSISITDYQANDTFLGRHPQLTGHNFWLIEIADTGVGIDNKYLSQIFDPFFTHKKKEKGTGLGLTMVYHIVRQHQGLIKVYSEPGKGTTFYLYFPVVQMDLTSSPTPDMSIIFPHGSGRILVIDDEEIMRETAREILEECGYQVVLASGGIEGIERYKNHLNHFDLVLLDMAMPEMSGQKVTAELKKIDSNVKIILSSGFKFDQRIQSTIDMGIAGFIQKPYTLRKLACCIHDTLQQSLMRDS